MPRVSADAPPSPPRVPNVQADAELLAAFGPHVPRFRFLLDDLSAQTDADLRARTRMTAGGTHPRARVPLTMTVTCPANGVLPGFVEVPWRGPSSPRGSTRRPG